MYTHFLSIHYGLIALFAAPANILGVYLYTLFLSTLFSVDCRACNAVLDHSEHKVILY